MIFVDGDTTTTGTSIPDIVLELYSPTNVLLATKDTGTNPEFIALELPATGTYTVRVTSFVPTQGGDFLYQVSNAELPEPVLSDYNLLFFLSTGQFIGALAEQNTLTNRPIELGGINATVTIQLVIARANTPTPSRQRRGPDPLRRLRQHQPAGILQLSRSGDLRTQLGGGRDRCRGLCRSMRRSCLRPSPRRARRLSTSTRTAGASGTWSIARSRISRRWTAPTPRSSRRTPLVDEDTFPNFFGTSAAAPHAAAIAALVLDAAGGPGSVKPKKMRKILQDSAFAHDLDPYFSSGFGLSLGNLLAINASADPNAISQFDPNVFTVTHFGRRALTNLSINGTGGNPTNSPGGIVFDERAAPLPAPGQPFVVGRTEGLTPLDVLGHVLAARGSAGRRGAVEAARPLVPAGNVRRAVICCRSASIAMKRTLQVRAARREATQPTCSAAAC